MKMLLNQAAVMIHSPEDAVDRVPHLKLLNDEIIVNLKCSILNLKKSITCNRNKVLPSQVSFLCGSAGKESPCNAGDLGSIPGVGKIPTLQIPGEGNSYPLQYSGLENSTDCIVHGVAKSRTQLSDFHFHR